MNRDPAVWIVAVGFAVLHFLLHLGLGLGRGAPDLLSVSLLIAARKLDVGAASGLGFVFGLLEDAFSVLSFGANTLSMTVVGILGSRTRDLFVGDSALFLFGYFVAGAWLRIVLRWVVSGAAVREPFLQAVVVQGPVLAVYAALFGVAAVVFLGLRMETTP